MELMRKEREERDKEKGREAKRVERGGIYVA